MRAPETSPRSKHKLYLAEMERDLLKIGGDREEGCLSQVRQGRQYWAIREHHDEAGCPVELGCELLHGKVSGES